MLAGHSPCAENACYFPAAVAYIPFVHNVQKRGKLKHQSNYNPAERYTWRGGTVADILSKPEYMGHTVNFRTYKESYKDKRSKMTPIRAISYGPLLSNAMR